MKNDFLHDRPALRKMIRLAEIIVVSVLVIYATLTWRELKILRAAPVVLPAYWFIVTADVDQVNQVQAGGSWVSKDAATGNLQTATIDCVKSRMQCMESSAQVSVNEGGLLETAQTVFDIESWTESEIRTKVAQKPCVSRTLTLDIPNKQVKSVATAGKSPDATCKTAIVGEQTSSLVAGKQAHDDAVRNAKPF
ncbi:MAG: hypothetical protein IPP88_24320 [Betaproteobacteria bacterium]|nr:hypothetical protein [Betaproteobacteria bacterium]